MDFSSPPFDQDKYISVTMEFRCNFKCVHCMIEDTMDILEPTSDEVFSQILAEQKQTGRWQGLVMTGAEITLRRDLPDLARRAKAAGFPHIRIQTHGARLGDPEFASGLLDAGIDEFFVSVAGSDQKSHDEITTIPGAWDKMMAGLKFLDSHDHVRLLTNTVVTKLSYAMLPDLVCNLSGLKNLVQMEFWNFWPMAKTDEKDLCAPIMSVLPYLREAINQARHLGRWVEVKNFPECVLGDLGIYLVNDQPQLIIDPKFWDEFAKNGFYQCYYKDQCASQKCLGLGSAYIQKFGNEKNILTPIAK